MIMTERMQRYEREVVPLAVWACEQALERAGTAAPDITNLVFATCTGFVAPGPDQQVARSLSNRRYSRIGAADRSSEVVTAN